MYMCMYMFFVLKLSPCSNQSKVCFAMETTSPNDPFLGALHNLLQALTHAHGVKK